MKRNMDIRAMAKECGVCLWEVAEWFGISEQTFIRKLRRELPNDDKLKVYDAIAKIERHHKSEQSTLEKF